MAASKPLRAEPSNVVDRVTTIDDDPDDTEADITLVGDPWTRSGERQVARTSEKKKSDIRELLLSKRTSSGVVSVASVERAAAAQRAPSIPRPTPSVAPAPPPVPAPAPAPPLALALSPAPAPAPAPEPEPPPPIAPIFTESAAAPPLPVPSPLDTTYEDDLRRLSRGPLDGLTRLLLTALLFAVLVLLAIAKLPFRAIALLAHVLAAHWARASELVTRSRSR